MVFKEVSVPNYKNNDENLPSVQVSIYSEYREGKAGQEIGSEIDFL